MLQELLVVFACVSNQGCGPTSNAYIHHNPERIKQAQLIEKRVVSSIPKQYQQATSTLYLIFKSKQLNIKLNRKSTLTIAGRDDKFSLGYIVEL